MRIYKVCLALGLVATLASCNSFLDEMPDNRQTLDRPDKIKSLLTSAYASIHHMGMLEVRTDNMADNGPRYQEGDLRDQEGYRWQDLTPEDFDSSKWYWDRQYSAIAAANQVIESAGEYGDPSKVAAIRAEALVARAWGHFNLVNYFARAYNSQTSASDLGVPYVVETEKRIGVVYPRETVKRTYELIDKDLTEALPLIDGGMHKTEASKYHFNKAAAHAFAAQFYLYYEQWEKAKQHATLAIGEDPSASLRNVAAYQSLNTGDEQRNAFTASAEPANLLLQNSNSLYGRRYINFRYAHNRAISRETFAGPGPWGDNLPSYSNLARNYTNNPDAIVFIWRYNEAFQITDKRNGIGIPNVITMPLTVDKTLLVRAEAKVMLNEFDSAAEDLSRYYKSKGGRTATAEDISNFYNIPADLSSFSEREQADYNAKLRGVAKPLKPSFTLAAGKQYNMIQAVLHARRVETLYEGDRWFDIKRYNIEITHDIPGGTPVVLKANDPRHAMQLPGSVTASGLPKNPR